MDLFRNYRLWHFWAKKKSKIKKTKINKGGNFNISKSINKRHKEVKKRNTFDNLELKSKVCLATFVEIKTRFYIALPMVDWSKNSMLEAVEKLIKSLPLEALNTFTSDRGKEEVMKILIVC